MTTEQKRQRDFVKSITVQADECEEFVLVPKALFERLRASLGPSPQERTVMEDLSNIPDFTHDLPSFDQLVDDTVKAIMDLELRTFEDHCIAANLKPIIAAAVQTAMDRCA